MTCLHRHNFYVFPRQELSVRGPSCEFLCQTASMDFLARYQFDFNLCLREGTAVTLFVLMKAKSELSFFFLVDTCFLKII